MIQLDAVEKKFSNRLILQIPQFRIEPGTYWITGANGSGKTTLLKMLAAVVPFKGDIAIQGTSLKKKPVAYRKLVSYAEAEPLYPEYLAGKEIVNLVASVRKVPKKKVDELLEMFHAHYYINTPTGTYSSGMLKKLSLIMAFLGDPAVVLLDEPLVTLDAESLPVVYNLIAAYRKQFDSTFLLTSHQEFKDTASLIDKTMLVQDQSLHFS